MERGAKSRILILGGSGYTGKAIARHLLEQSEISITLAARHREKVETLAQELNQRFSGGRVDVAQTDAADPRSLRAAFRGHSLVVVAAPIAACAENVARAALATGADYLDVQLSAGKFALLQSLAEEIEHSGRCFITEAGYHPGLPAVLVNYAAAHLDSIERAIIAGYLNMGKDLPYTPAVDELVESFLQGLSGADLSEWPMD